MKCSLFSILTLAVLLASCSNSSTIKGKLSGNNTLPKKSPLSLLSDSGYIREDAALQFLVGEALIDTTEKTDWEGHIRYAYSLKEMPSTDTTKSYSYWFAEKGDTIGKYYALGNTGNYIAALSLGREVLILRLTPQGSLIDYDLQGHGSHACCWNSIDDMLRKYGDYFGIKTCGTGSAYCSGYLHLFKDKINPPSESSIAVFEYVGAWGEGVPGHNLSSTLQFEGSNLIMHYKLEKLITNKSGKQKVVSTTHFTVKYVYGAKGFKTNEAYKLEGILE